MINKFEGEWAFLSNFHPWAFNFRGVWAPTAEHAFQAFKARNAQDMLYVMSAPTPSKAKYRGKSIPLRKDWEDIKLELMLEVLFCKFQLPERKELLLSTGNEILVEGNYWHDNFWGDCFCNKCPQAGKNYLGRLLMALRRELTPKTQDARVTS